jgi:hypothetical protein
MVSFCCRICTSRREYYLKGKHPRIYRLTTDLDPEPCTRDTEGKLLQLECACASMLVLGCEVWANFLSTCKMYCEK